MSSEYAVAIEDALARLVIQEDYDAGTGPGPCVHTFRQAGPALVGAHWHLDDLRSAMERYGVEEAGESASAMGHGLVLIDDNGPLFIEAQPSGMLTPVKRAGALGSPEAETTSFLGDETRG